MHDGRPWAALTVLEQTLLRRALEQLSLAGAVQHYATALRWSGGPEAPLRSWTTEEQLELAPQAAATALALADQGLVTVRERQGWSAAETDPVLPGARLRELLADPAVWLRGPKDGHRYHLAAGEAARERWLDAVYPVAELAGLPSWDELSVPQREVLVCATEASGMLTGPYGIWADLPPGVGEAERLAVADEQLAPLLPFVREGWIEVQHRPDADSDAFTVIPLEGLRTALADPDVRYEGEDAEEWGVGVTCCFTYAGRAVWRAGWSGGWAGRLTVD
ncbi:hypothetical protein ABT095_24120 [Kitasatospora sp. NPDC002227]|uniref:hypothetical protein n=1 Tax=Kitasatospora sp. NPDC002227 TaxID=3154773 RepID=UPI003318E415